MFKNELIQACANGESLKVKDLLNNKSFNINESSPSNGLTALHYVSSNGFLDVVKMLIEKGGANINQTDNAIQTPLFKASLAGNTGIVEYLISKGALINRQDKFESTPLFAICESLSQSVDGSKSAVSSAVNTLSAKLETIKLLLNQPNISIDQTNSSGKTALMMAAKSQIPILVQILINHGSNTDTKDHLGLSSYDYANNNQEIIKILKKEQTIDTTTSNSKISSSINNTCSNCKENRSTSKYCSFCGHKF